MNRISEFQKEYRFLSNFWPCYILYQDLVYPSAEHAYQSAKVDDIEIKSAIRDCATPADAKDYFDTHEVKRSVGWTVEKKLRIMEEILVIKFSGKDPWLTRALLDTGDAELIEGNNWNDTFWGVYDNTGENHLGRLLMKVRADLFTQKKNILHELSVHHRNEEVARALGLSERVLYEKMIAFSIPNKEYWIS